MSLSHQRVRSALLLALAALLAIAVGWRQHNAAASGNQKATAAKQQPENLALKHSLSGKAPKGSWSVSAIPDLAQATDTATPVVVSGLSSLFGKKELGGFLKVIAVKLTNRSPEAVAGVRLGWLIVTEKDRAALKSDAEAKRAEGETTFFETEIAPHGIAKLDSAVVDFLAEAKPLLKKGRLNGDFVIKVRVIEVEFVDGSIWREQESLSKAGDDYRASRQGYTPLYEPMTACSNTKCKSENNDGILDGCIDDPFSGLHCVVNFNSCNPERTQCVCNNNVCTDCPDADGDDVTTCEGDCNDNNYSIGPLAPENCTNGIDDNCDGLIDRYDTYWCKATPTPTPGGGGVGSDNPEYDPNCGSCGSGSGGGGIWSPIVLDIEGDGFDLTDYLGGAPFDLNNDGNRGWLSWTAHGSDEAWLALDRNGNGTIDDGTELFGNFTPQPAPPAGEERNGFLALAPYDQLENGGDSDGVITRRDAVFASLRLWQDENHNGLSESHELHTLSSLGVRRLHLNYKESEKRDAHGNRFKYRARADDGRDGKLGRWAWDVFLVTSP